MTSLATGLPPEVAAAIPFAWRENEKVYWVAQPTLLVTHRGLWVAFEGGSVVASGPSAVEVFHAAAASAGHPFVARVGAEDEPCRMRVAFPSDVTCAGEVVGMRSYVCGR